MIQTESPRVKLKSHYRCSHRWENSSIQNSLAEIQMSVPK